MPVISSVGPVAVDVASALTGDGTVCHPLGLELNVALNGGINGDGSPTNPLSVAVDGTTLTITNNLITAHALTDPQSGLTGDGTSSTPLEINVDNNTVKINGSNQLVATPLTITANGALAGTGGAANPLHVNVDGTTVIINGSNQLTSPVIAQIPLVGNGTSGTPLGIQLDNVNAVLDASNRLTAKVGVAPGAAMFGDGSQTNRLGVQVDGVSVKIDGSNRLTAISGVLGDSLFKFASAHIPPLTMNNLFTIPINIVPAVAGAMLVPIVWFANIFKGDTNVYIPVNLQLLYDTGTNLHALPDIAMNLQGVDQGGGLSIKSGVNVVVGINTPTFNDPTPTGKGLVVQPNQPTSFTASGPITDVHVLYYVWTLP